tara:strand:- start:2693 stop:2950 length:258 start_codon:yes stop_codon:yes gene_type:complete
VIVVEYTISFSTAFVEQSFTIRGELMNRRGIHFDTGIGPDGVDWFMDYSLTSKKYTKSQCRIYVKEALDRAKIPYVVLIHTDSEE